MDVCVDWYYASMLYFCVVKRQSGAVIFFLTGNVVCPLWVGVEPLTQGSRVSDGEREKDGA